MIVIPSELHYITKEGEKFEAAVETLMNAKEIGVSIQFEAQLLPRDGCSRRPQSAVLLGR